MRYRTLGARRLILVGGLLAGTGCTGEFPTIGQFADRYEGAYPDRQLDHVARVMDEDKSGTGFKGHFDVGFHNVSSGEAGTDRINYFRAVDGVTPERRF